MSDIDNTNTFTVTFTGIISGLSGLVAGEYYFVSTTSAGNLTSTKPINGYENPILFATDTVRHEHFFGKHLILFRATSG